MDTPHIGQLIEEAAEKIREGVRSQRDTWRILPHWYLEAQGRLGWSDDGFVVYGHGLFSLDTATPPRVYVDCYNGELVDGNTRVVSFATVVATYLEGRSFDASVHVNAMMELARRESDLVNDAHRREIRRRYGVKQIRDTPPTPIEWHR